jgi:hypothetical protein
MSALSTPPTCYLHPPAFTAHSLPLNLCLFLPALNKGTGVVHLQEKLSVVTMAAVTTTTPFCCPFAPTDLPVPTVIKDAPPLAPSSPCMRLLASPAVFPLAPYRSLTSQLLNGRSTPVQCAREVCMLGRQTRHPSLISPLPLPDFSFSPSHPLPPLPILQPPLSLTLIDLSRLSTRGESNQPPHCLPCGEPTAVPTLHALPASCCLHRLSAEA